MDKLNQFKAKLKEIYPEIFSEVFDTISDEKRFFSFRVNSLKATTEEVLNFLDIAKLVYYTGPLANSFYSDVANKTFLSHSDLFIEGKIYIQSFSSMLAVWNLLEDAKAPLLNALSARLLDVCAAPGGKSAYAAALSSNQIAVLALDNNFVRVNAMRENFNVLGVENAEIQKMDAGLAQKDPTLTNEFDFVIADVPCSNEGLLRNLNEQSLSKWNSKVSKHLPLLQKKILASAINCLKPGGTLVYSTCTYSPLENESVVDWALKKFTGIDLLPINTFDAKVLPGFSCWKNKTYDARISMARRILPSDIYDGFFIAKLTRRIAD